jgi:hypothetical protein
MILKNSIGIVLLLWGMYAVIAACITAAYDPSVGTAALVVVLFGTLACIIGVGVLLI